MTEERVTKHILKWLMDNDWNIVCYDFPQSGTGRLLHPNGSNSKNQLSINPDIVAVKGDKCIFFENKDRFYYPDFEKINVLITRNDYSNAISELLKNYEIVSINYGIGFPVKAYTGKVIEAEQLVDFIIGVEESGEIRVLYKKDSVECLD